MWTVERQQEFRLCEDETAIQHHMRIDLLALEGLTSQLPLATSARVITEKGYAVDALQGRLTRLHYDADIVIANPFHGERQQTISLIKEILERTTQLPWTTYEWEKPDADSWVKFCEADKRRWHEGETGTKRDNELANSIDVHLVHAPEPFAEDEHITFRSRSGKQYRQSIRQARLWDALGRPFELTIPTVNEQLASKMHFSRSFEHRLRDSDFYDFALMFKHEGFEPVTFASLFMSYLEGRGYSSQASDEIIKTELRWLNGHVELPESLYPYLSA